MRDPGNECPECGGEVRRGRCVSCDWGGNSKGKPDKPCERCGAPFQFWTSITKGDDGIWRCAMCHVDYLKQRAVAGRICTELDGHGNLCGKTADEHRREFFALRDQLVKKMTTAQESWRTTPSLLERKGIHPLRPSVRRALNLAETAPDPTPEQWAEHERKKAEARRHLRLL